MWCQFSFVQNNVAGALCNECKAGFFHLSQGNPEGCLQCFCMGVTRQCSSSSWSRDQARFSGINASRQEGSSQCLRSDVPSQLIVQTCERVSPF